MNKPKERASILWLLSKAYNKNIPNELREPYYKNNHNEDILKPQVVQGLTSCELYCMALTYTYDDLNYANLDHFGIIQLLIRKGIQISELNDLNITETVLVQNSPIRMSAHMAIIDAIMSLFIKDILIPEKVLEVISRFDSSETDKVLLEIEEVALFWLNKCSERFKQIIEDELNTIETESISYIPCLPYIQDITELSNGCSLVALLSFYCPNYLNWREVILKEEMTLEESIKNLETVQYFCAKYLPYDICFIEIENFLKIKSSMRINILAFISDLLYLFEINPASCVRRPFYDEEFGYEYEENKRLTHNNNLSMINNKRMRDLVAAEMRTRTMQHTSWVNDEDENISEDVSLEQHKKINYLQNEQYQNHIQEVYELSECESRNNGHESQILNDHLSRSRSKNDHILNNEFQSININKDSSSENEVDTNLEIYLNQNVNSNSQNLNGNYLLQNNSDDSEASSTLSFAKLSKLKSAAINVAYMNDKNNSPRENNKQLKNLKFKNLKLKQNDQSNDLNTSIDSNGNNTNLNCDKEETDIANQILEIHLKLEEKRKQIELERSQMETLLKSQRRDISNEAFLKALKIEKMLHSVNENDSQNANKLSALELKESLNNLRRNLSQVDDSKNKSNQYYNDIKSSIEILSSNVNDLENDLNLLEQEKILAKHQKQNLNQFYIDHNVKQQSLSTNQNENNETESKFFLHYNNSETENQINNFLNNSLQSKEKFNNRSNLQNYLTYTSKNQNEIDKHLIGSLKHNNLKNLNLMNDSLNSISNETEKIFNEQTLIGHLSKNHIKNLNDVEKNKNVTLYNNNMNEKGFFILFDDGKPKAKPPVLNSMNLKDKHILGDNQSHSNKTFSRDESNKAKLGISQDSVGFVIGHDLVNPDPKSEFAKAKKKEFIMNQSMKRKADQEEKLRMMKEDMLKKFEEERKKREMSDKRKEENRLRREAILEQYRLRKLQEDSEKDNHGFASKTCTLNNKMNSIRARPNSGNINRSRPKSIHIGSGISNAENTNFTSLENYRTSKLIGDHLDAALINYPSSVMSNFSSFNHSLRPQSSMSSNSTALKKLYLTTGNKNDLPSLPPFMITNRLNKGSGSSDGVSEIGSTYSEYTGPKLYVKPAQKSNRGIILNAINVVLGGAVNLQTQKKVLEEINKNSSKHFLILFRGSGMQFRAIYSYNPDIEEVIKLHGTGPKSINNDMIDKFYKYNSGGKNFNEVHTKHLTVTIDAITIHNQLWAGKKMAAPKKNSF